jgi:hypothetical protein
MNGGTKICVVPDVERKWKSAIFTDSGPCGAPKRISLLFSREKEICGYLPPVLPPIGAMPAGKSL